MRRHTKALAWFGIYLFAGLASTAHADVIRHDFTAVEGNTSGPYRFSYDLPLFDPSLGQLIRASFDFQLVSAAPVSTFSCAFPEEPFVCQAGNDLNVSVETGDADTSLYEYHSRSIFLDEAIDGELELVHRIGFDISNPDSLTAFTTAPFFIAWEGLWYGLRGNNGTSGTLFGGEKKLVVSGAYGFTPAGTVPAPPIWALLLLATVLMAHRGNWQRGALRCGARQHPGDTHRHRAAGRRDRGQL